MSKAPAIVAVTGASGYIAGHVVKQLLDAGYAVRGSVRSLANVEKVAHLKSLFDDNPNFSLHEADLLKEGSFDEMMKGADYVMHTASPFLLSHDDPQRDLVDPAVKGTTNVVVAALKHSNAKRIVVTSSCAAIAWQRTPPIGKIWTEEDWNEDSTLTEGPYRLSKAEAERTAWKLIKEYDGPTDLAVINPAFVVGPPLSNRTDSSSVQIVRNLMDGTDRAAGGWSSANFGCVDVRDVALAHVRAMERPEAGGKRFICSSEEGIDREQFTQMLKSADDLKDFDYPTKFRDAQNQRPKYSHKQAEDVLGIEFHPIKDALVEMARFLIANGMVHKPAKDD